MHDLLMPRLVPHLVRVVGLGALHRADVLLELARNRTSGAGAPSLTRSPMRARGAHSAELRRKVHAPAPGSVLSRLLAPPATQGRRRRNPGSGVGEDGEDKGPAVTSAPGCCPRAIWALLMCASERERDVCVSPPSVSHLP